METDNETVAEAIAAVRKMIHDCYSIKGGIGEFEYQLKANGAIDRIESAHKREIAVKDAEIAELKRKLDLHDLYASEECEDADTARIVAEEETAAKDREIAELRETINMDSASMAGKDAVIAELKRRPRVAEDALTANITRVLTKIYGLLTRKDNIRFFLRRPKRSKNEGTKE